MADAVCFLCKKDLPHGQSYYEDHDVKVCLSCYRTTPRCSKCNFPSRKLTSIGGIGRVCESCLPQYRPENANSCYLCDKPIWPGMSYFEGHNQVVCQECFKDCKYRCFYCRFPQTKEVVSGIGGVCPFCADSLLHADSNLETFITPLHTFVRQFEQEVIASPQFVWLGWKELMNMQLKQPVSYPINFFDEFLQFVYPIYYIDNKFHILKQLPPRWFMVYMGGQMVAADLCRQHQLPHIKGLGPFQQLARGWVHWIMYSTAKVLQYEAETKTLARKPESEEVVGAFSKFLAMTEYRKSSEIIQSTHQNLIDYASRYL